MDEPPSRNFQVAPSFRVRNRANEEISLSAFEGEPVILAFLDTWQRNDGDALTDAIRAQLRGLGAALIVVAEDGVFAYRPEDAVHVHTARSDLADGQIAVLRHRYRAAQGELSLFVVDAGSKLRLARRLRIEGRDVRGALLSSLVAAARDVTKAPPTSITRREVIVTSLVSAFALVLAEACRGKDSPQPAGVTSSTAAEQNSHSYESDVTLNINGADHTLRIEPNISLLDALRERLSMQGTKKGCDHGQCGACTVLMDDRRVKSCLILAIMAQGSKIQTIEGLAQGDNLHPMQVAFATSDALQCGYCTPGQIMSAIGLLKENRAKTDDEVREQMSGNICRCGAYANIVSAVQLARKPT